MKHRTYTKGSVVGFVIGGVIVLGILVFVVPLVVSSLNQVQYDRLRNHEQTDDTTGIASTSVVEVPRVTHLATPSAVKGVYMSQCVVGTPSFREKLVTLIEETEINSVVIDIKDFSGRIAFETDHPLLKESIMDHCGAGDMQAFIQTLHDKGIYVIGRITVFQDPYYTKLHPELAVKRVSDGAVWQDRKGLSFIDVGAKPYWDFVVALIETSYAIGFDELNLDYIRYPSDGNLSDIAFTWSKGKTKEEMLESFFAYVYAQVKQDKEPDETPILSADLFGMTTTAEDGMGIGQVIERALPYFDYVMPMVYPSHYPPQFNGWANPAVYPYDLILFVMRAGARRATMLGNAEGTTSTSTEALYLKRLANSGHRHISKEQLRPWLQDFDLGATYTADMVRAQIQATYDAGLTSWVLWDPSNQYTRGALLDAEKSVVQ